MHEIFFVHDHQESPGLRKHFLERSGYEVHLFTSGAECLAMLEQRTPALVLMDVLIDGANGFEVCRAMRERFRAHELPVVLGSSIYHGRVFRDEAMGAGAQAYVVRPIEPDDLMKIVNDLAATRGAPQPVH